MNRTLIVVNLKAYDSAVGKNSENVIEACRKASESTGEKVVVAPQPEDIFRVEGVEAFAQHVDGVEAGSHTGSILAKGVKDAGASGTLLNHSENRLRDRELEASINAADSLGLTTIVCAQTPEECRKYSSFGPDFIAYEPPELIGGDTSVSEAKPHIVEEAVEKTVEGVETLTGAGIKKREDVEKSIELGCKGVLVASGVVKAKDIQEEVEELCEGL
ncbi:MAG: triose-phosphate isomerase [Candidatus Nanohalobium sp.]